MSVFGHERHLRRLRKLRDGADELDKVLFAGGKMIETEARLSITRGSVSGKGHVASLPGQPPKNDTGHLASNITTRRVGPGKVEVRSEASYAAALEFGTSKMAERPYMRPATRKAEPKIKAMTRHAVSIMVKGS